MAFVIDASTVLAWIFDDETSPYADEVLDRLQMETGVAPSIWPLEVANGLWRAERQNRLTVAKVVRSVELIVALPIRIDDTTSDMALGRVLTLARTHSLTAYDASYLELAIRDGLSLATEDRDLRAAAERSGVALF